MADSAVMNFEDIWKRTAVAGVTISNPPATAIILGESFDLKAILDPIYASNKDVAWEVISGDAVIVDENGLLTAVALGAAVVKVTTSDGGFSDTCEITVTPVPVSSVQLENCPGDLLIIEDTVRLTASVLPADAADKTIFWSSSDTMVAAMDTTGLVTAKSPGISTITVTTNDGNYKSSCNLEVKSPLIHVSRVNLTGYISEDLYVGEDLQLGATISPSNATDQMISWSSSDTAVAMVSADGMVTALSEGNATVTVITNDGGFMDEYNMNVLESLSSSGSVYSEFSLKGIKLYPNPAKKRLYIEFSDSKKEHRICVYDNLGKQVYEKKTEQAICMIDLDEDIMAGLLAIYVYSENDILAFKLIVTR